MSYENTPHIYKIGSQWANYIDSLGFSILYQQWIDDNFPNNGFTIDTLPSSFFQSFINDKHNFSLDNDLELPFKFNNGTINLLIANKSDISNNFTDDLKQEILAIDHTLPNMEYRLNYIFNNSNAYDLYQYTEATDIYNNLIIQNIITNPYPSSINAHTIWFMVHHGGVQLSPFYVINDSSNNIIIKSSYEFISEIDQSYIITGTTAFDFFKKAYFADWLLDGYKKLRAEGLLLNTHQWRLNSTVFTNNYYKDINNGLADDDNMSFEFWFDQAYGPNSPTYNTQLQLVIGGHVNSSNLDIKFNHSLNNNNSIFQHSIGESSSNPVYQATNNGSLYNAYINYNYITEYKADLSNNLTNDIYEKWYMDNHNRFDPLNYDEVIVSQQLQELYTYLSNNEMPNPINVYIIYNFGNKIIFENNYNNWYIVNYGSNSQQLQTLFPDLVTTLHLPANVNDIWINSYRTLISNISNKNADIYKDTWLPNDYSIKLQNNLQPISRYYDWIKQNIFNGLDPNYQNQSISSSNDTVSNESLQLLLLKKIFNSNQFTNNDSNKRVIIDLNEKTRIFFDDYASIQIDKYNANLIKKLNIDTLNLGDNIYNSPYNIHKVKIIDKNYNSQIIDVPYYKIIPFDNSNLDTYIREGDVYFVSYTGSPPFTKLETNDLQLLPQPNETPPYFTTYNGFEVNNNNIFIADLSNDSFKERFDHNFHYIIEYLSYIYPNGNVDIIPSANTLEAILKDNNLISNFLVKNPLIVNDNITDEFTNPDVYFLKNFTDTSDNIVFQRYVDTSSYDTVPVLNYSSRKRPWFTYYDWLVMKMTNSQSPYYSYSKLIDIGYFNNFDNLSQWIQTYDSISNELYIKFHDSVVFIEAPFDDETKYVYVTNEYGIKHYYNIRTDKTNSNLDQTYIDNSNNIIQPFFNASSPETISQSTKDSLYQLHNIDFQNNGVHVLEELNVGSYYKFIFNELTSNNQAYYAFFNLSNIPITDNNASYTYPYQFTVINVTHDPSSNPFVTDNGIPIDAQSAYELGVSNNIIDNTVFTDSSLWYNSINNDLKILWAQLSFRNSIPTFINFYTWILYKSKFHEWHTNELSKTEQFDFYNGLYNFGSYIPESYWLWLITKELNILGIYNYTPNYLQDLYDYNVSINSFSRDDYGFEEWYNEIFGVISIVPLQDRWKGIPIDISYSNPQIYDPAGFINYPIDHIKDLGYTYTLTNDDTRILNNGVIDNSGTVVFLPINNSLYEPNDYDLCGNLSSIEYNITAIKYAGDIKQTSYNSRFAYRDNSDYLNAISYNYSNIYYPPEWLLFNFGIVEEVDSDPYIPNCASIKCKPEYKKIKTAYNNPSMSSKMRYSEYIRTSKPGRINTTFYYTPIEVLEWKLQYGLDLSFNAKIATGVTNIPDNQYRNNINVNNVLFQDNISLIRIGANAFRSSGIVNINISTSLLDIDISAFRNTFHLNNIFIPHKLKIIPFACFYNSNIIDISGGIGVEYIDDYAFSHTKLLNNFDISNSLLEIGDYCFFNSGLINFNFPPKLRIIGKYSFYSIPNLISINISTPLIKINAYSFADCINLNNISFNSDSKLYTIDEFAFYNDTSLTNITFPDNLYEIKYKAFSFCSFISLIFPNNIKHIGDSSFEYQGFSLKYNSHSSTLTDISLNGTITIGKRAFYNNPSLNSPILPNTLTHIYDQAFRLCRNISIITIPDNTYYLGDGIFKDCINLLEINVGSSVTTLSNFLFDTCSNLSKFTTNGVILSMGNYCFLNVRGIININFASRCMYFGIGCFKGCSYLQNILLNYKLQHIPDNLFYNCGSLRNGGEDGTTFHFTNPDTLEPLIFNNDDINEPDERGSYLTIGKYAYFKTGLLRYTISPNTTSIDNYAFFQCSSLLSINLYSTNLTTIGEGTFQLCSNLRYLIIPSSVTHFGTNLLYGCVDLRALGLSWSQAVNNGFITNDFLPNTDDFDNYTIYSKNLNRTISSIQRINNYYTNNIYNKFTDNIYFYINYGSISYNRLVSISPNLSSANKTFILSNFNNNPDLQVGFGHDQSNDPNNNIITNDFPVIKTNFINGTLNTLLNVNDSFTPPSNIFGLWNNTTPLKPSSVNENVCLPEFQIISSSIQETSWISHYDGTKYINEQHHLFAPLNVNDNDSLPQLADHHTTNTDISVDIWKNLYEKPAFL
jgi:hypothetical protein